MLGSKFPSARKKTKLDKIDNIFESIVREISAKKQTKQKSSSSQIVLLCRYDPRI
jgi:hypothetical protein